jgi:hypothetical protein
MSKGLLELSPTWCNNKIITYDFCLDAYDCLSGTTSPMPTLYNSKVYYEISATTPTTYLWWSSNLNKWVFSVTLGTPSNITLDYTGDYPYTSTVKWDGDFVDSSYFRTCDCTCFTKPNYSDNNFLPINECGVITIYPMGISCTPIPPSKVGGTGSLSLLITGGTPPYSIRLLNSTGNSTYGVISSSNVFNIPNLLPGTYFVEVTDNFGDFQQVINCSITTTTTSTTTTTTLPQTPSYPEYSFCMQVNLINQVRQSQGFAISFVIYSFISINNIITPIFISNTGYEFVSWDYTNNLWSLSALTSSQFSSSLGVQTPTNWKIINQTPIPFINGSNLPLGSWSLIPTPFNTYSGTISAVPAVCKAPTLVFWINESWWQYYGANIPSQYRGSSCGGNNKTPYFRWMVQNLGGLTVTKYDILCTNNANTYFDVTDINSGQTGVSDTIPWITSPTPPIINPTTGSGTANSQGWKGACLSSFVNPNFTVTLTATLSNTTTLTASINFIYCQTVTNGICGI